MVDNPEFELPFRLTATGAVEIEQGSPNEIQQCVYATCCYRPGEFLPNLAFGIPDQLFQKGGTDLDALEAAIAELDPRAVEVFTRDPDWITTLVERITIRRQDSG